LLQSGGEHRSLAVDLHMAIVACFAEQVAKKSELTVSDGLISTYFQ